MDIDSNSESVSPSDIFKSILKKTDNNTKKNVCISDELAIIDDKLDGDGKSMETNISEIEKLENIFVDRSTSPNEQFSMEEFLSSLASTIDITKINDHEIKDEIFNDGKNRNVNCNTLYTTDIFTLHNTVINSQDRRKTKEERKREREKKKEEEMMKKFQKEQEAKNKAIARSKCGRWVKFNIKIGEGGYKFVYRGYDVEEAKNIAWCEFKREHVDTKEKRQSMFRETEIMLKMNHSHIVRCFGVLNSWDVGDDPQYMTDEKGIVIIQELMGEGTLKNMIKKNFVNGECILQSSLILAWCHQVLDGLKYMHQKCNPPIIHRDLKADNCFLYSQADDECLNVKVGDFGLATHVKTGGRKTMLGTIGFMAPEVFDEKYDESIDIYAFGMLMLEVMTNRTPFDDCETVVKIAAKTLCGEGPKVLEMVKDKCLKEIINMCIHPMACFRPTAEEMYLHPIFYQIKGLLLEVELNYDKVAKRIEVYEPFYKNFPACTKVNLRLKFREIRMQQELGLDDTESLEFDLDIYKGEDQDIPELIQNLRSEYEDKLIRFYDNPKITDKRTIDANLDKLFLSIRLQLQYLVKYILGKRWRDILDGLVAEMAAKTNDSVSEFVGDDEGGGNTRFSEIGECKRLWNRAKRLLDKEIQEYRANSKVLLSEVKLNENTNENGSTNEVSVIQMSNLNLQTQQSNEMTPIMGDFLNPLDIESFPFQQQNIPTNSPVINAPITSANNTSVVTNTAPADRNPINNFIDNNCVKNKIEETPGNIKTPAESTLDNQVSEIKPPVPLHNVCVMKIKLMGGYYVVKFSVEIPSLLNGGKYVGVYKAITHVNDGTYDKSETVHFDISQINNFDNFDKEIISALRDTIVTMLKIISYDKDAIPLHNYFVFYPISQNILFTENWLDRFSGKVNQQNSNKVNVMREDVNNNPKPLHDQKSKPTKSTLTEIDELFEHESTILLTKRLEGNKHIIRSHQVPLGSGIIVTSKGALRNICKTSVISPKLHPNGDLFIREFDNSDVSLETVINLLSYLQNHIAEVNSKSQITLNGDLESKILYERLIENNVSLSSSLSGNFSGNPPPGGYTHHDGVESDHLHGKLQSYEREVKELRSQMQEMCSLFRGQYTNPNISNINSNYEQATIDNASTVMSLPGTITSTGMDNVQMSLGSNASKMFPGLFGYSNLSMEQLTAMQQQQQMSNPIVFNNNRGTYNMMPPQALLQHQYQHQKSQHHDNIHYANARPGGVNQPIMKHNTNEANKMIVQENQDSFLIQPETMNYFNNPPYHYDEAALRNNSANLVSSASISASSIAVVSSSFIPTSSLTQAHSEFKTPADAIYFHSYTANSYPHHYPAGGGGPPVSAIGSTSGPSFFRVAYPTMNSDQMHKDNKNYHPNYMISGQSQNTVSNSSDISHRPPMDSNTVSSDITHHSITDMLHNFDNHSNYDRQMNKNIGNINPVAMTYDSSTVNYRTNDIHSNHTVSNNTNQDTCNFNKD